MTFNMTDVMCSEVFENITLVNDTRPRAVGMRLCSGFFVSLR